jgi:hypothetical protein
MAKRRNYLPSRKVSGALLSASLLTGGLAGLSLGMAGTAGADNSGSQVCGPSLSISGAATATAPLALSLPQYNGTGTITAAALSLKVTESYQGSFLTSGGQSYPGNGTNDFVGVSSVLEGTGPGLGSLSPVTVGAIFKGGGPNGFTAGDPAPTLPAGVATANGISADGVGTGTPVPGSWTTLGFPFTPSSPSPATAQGTVTFTTAGGTIPLGSFPTYSGTGNVTINAADYSSDSVSSDSAGFNGASVTTSVAACITYTVLQAETPEAPSILLLPASAAAVGFGAFLVVRRRRSKTNLS